MNYVGIDWAYGRAAWCAVSEGGAIEAEGLIPADEDGLARLVLRLGTEIRACVEMMSGAIWVRDQLQSAGWSVAVAHARKVRDIAPLACKTDKVDARVLAELCRRDLVPALWVASPEDRAIRERLRRRAHLIKLRTSARNRIFGLLTQFGLRISFACLRQPGAAELLERRGVPEVWCDFDRHPPPPDRGARPQDHPDRPRARPDRALRPTGRAAAESPASGLDQPHLRRGDRRRLTLLPALDLVGYAGLAPRISQLGERSQTGRLSKAGSRTLRWAAVEAAQTRPGGRPTRFTATIAGFLPGTERIRRSRRSPASSSASAPGTCSRETRSFNPTDQLLPLKARAAFWPPDGPAWN